MELSEDDVRIIRAVLDDAAWALADAGDGFRNRIEYARGALTGKTLCHDAGAVARCSRCGRYTNDVRALRNADDPSCAVCNCGEKHYWTGSFVKPTADLKWRLPHQKGGEG